MGGALPAAVSRAAEEGNAYKAMLEHGMTSGLYYVVAINVLTASLGLVVYHYVIQRQAGLLSLEEIALLRKYPVHRPALYYTPEETHVRGAPPQRWTGWYDFLTAPDNHLSRDAQVYLLFQRVCIATTALCAVFSSAILLPAYWSGGALVGPGQKPLSLINLLRSDRGVFERFTSHNLPADSPLVLLQIPVVALAAACVVVLHTLVHAAAREHRTLEDWLRTPSDRPGARPALDDTPAAPFLPTFHSEDMPVPEPPRGPPPPHRPRPLSLPRATVRLAHARSERAHPRGDVAERYVGLVAPVFKAGRFSMPSLPAPVPGVVAPNYGYGAVPGDLPVYAPQRRHPQRLHPGASAHRAEAGSVVEVRGEGARPRDRGRGESEGEPSTPPGAVFTGSFLGRSPHSPIPEGASFSGGYIAGWRREWTLFARGLPLDIRSRSELEEVLDTIYPGQVLSVELVCKGRMSEARVHRELSTAENRLKYLLDSPQLELEVAAGVPGERTPFSPPAQSCSHALWKRVLRTMFRKRCTWEGLVHEHHAEIRRLQVELAERAAEPVTHFLGCAFITVRSPEVAYSLINDFPLRFFMPDENSRVPVSSIRASPNLAVYGDAGRPWAQQRDEIDFANPDVWRDLVEVPYYHARHQGFLHDEDDTRGGWRVLRLNNLYLATMMTLPLWLRQRIMGDDASGPPLLRGSDEKDPLLNPIFAGLSKGVSLALLRSMKAERAPKSGDVLWNNIGMSFFERTCREVIVQLLVFAFLIVFTSPVAMLTALKLVFSEVALLSEVGQLRHNGTHAHHHHHSSMGVANLLVSVSALSTNSTLDPGGGSTLSFGDMGVQNATADITNTLMDLLPHALTSNTVLRSVLLAYIPVMLLAVTFAMVPSLLRVISNLEGYPTHSDREMSIFRKTSFYYLMNSVLLPSLALNTASEFLEMVFERSNGGANVYKALPILQTLFSGDIAFFLCNYLVQLGLTGSVVWLMRIPSSLSMMVRRRLALTPLEEAEAKCTSVFDFPRHYSYSVAVMAMCLLFGFMAPAIWFFACFYYVCKFHVDLYLLRYVHPRTHIDGRLPKLASTLVLVWTLVSQLALAVIFYLQGWVRGGLITALIGGVTLLACVSVGQYIGIRMLSVVSVIPRARDYLINRVVMRMFDRAQTPLEISSPTSSSSGSLRDTAEVDSVLRMRRTWPVQAGRDTLPAAYPEDTVLSDESDRDDLVAQWSEGGISFRSAYGSTGRI